jgi:hypothetical protein
MGMWACSRSPSTSTEGSRSVVPAGLDLIRSWDWHGVIGTGQSLAVGVDGTPPRTTRPSHRNMKLDLGGRLFPASDPSSPRLSLVPLQEPIRPLTWGYPGPYPGNIYGETPHTAMANQVTAMFLHSSGGSGDYVTVHSVVGESGQGIDVLGKDARPTANTGRAYEASLFETRAIARLAKRAGRSFGVSAILLTHGETDAASTKYASAVRELRRDYNRDLLQITHQTQSVPLLLTQQSSSPLQPGSIARSALQAWAVSQEEPQSIVCVGPRYQYSYVADGVHLDALGYARLGEKYGQVYFERIVRGVDWRPLAPIGAKREGSLITVEFHVPVPPMTWEAAFPGPHHLGEWAAGRGFELSARGERVTIERVELVGSRVLIRHTAQAGPLLLRYAATAMAQKRPGGSWRWGQLRDSDEFVGATTGMRQPNYAVSFELEIP